jgi:hypothetical protein
LAPPTSVAFAGITLTAIMLLTPIADAARRH